MRRAFTLLEAIVSIALLSIVIAFAAFSFRFFVGNLRHYVTVYPEFAMKVSKLRDSVRSIYCYVEDKGDRFDVKERFSLFFFGDRESVKFISDSPVFQNKLSIIYLFFKEGELVLKEHPVYSRDTNYLSPEIPERVPEEVLLKGIENLNFGYIVNGTQLQEVSDVVPDALILSFVKDGKSYSFTFRVCSKCRKKLVLTRMALEWKEAGL